MAAYTLTDIYVYPIKSLGGIRLNEALIEKRGLQYDRRWMLTDENGQFLTQRKYAQMSLLQVEISENGLQVSHKKQQIQPLFIPFEPSDEKTKLVNIWEDISFAFEENADTNKWFSEALGITCKLVFMPDNAMRQVDQQYARPKDLVSFADAYPFLIIGEESLKDLNLRLTDPIPMDRFRPNLVFSGGAAFDEDTWTEFTIDGATFFPVKPCARCVVTTIDQQTAKKSDEPLKTLATYRTQNNKIMFGQNLIHNGAGRMLKVGQTLEIID